MTTFAGVSQANPDLGLKLLRIANANGQSVNLSDEVPTTVLANLEVEDFTSFMQQFGTDGASELETSAPASVRKLQRPTTIDDRQAAIASFEEKIRNACSLVSININDGRWMLRFNEENRTQVLADLEANAGMTRRANGNSFGPPENYFIDNIEVHLSPWMPAYTA